MESFYENHDNKGKGAFLNELKVFLENVEVPEYMSEINSDKVLDEILRDIQNFLNKRYKISIVENYRNERNLQSDLKYKVELKKLGVILQPVIEELLEQKFENNIELGIIESFYYENEDLLKNQRQTDVSLIANRNKEMNTGVGESKAWHRTLIFALVNDYDLNQIYYLCLEVINNAISQKLTSCLMLSEFLNNEKEDNIEYHEMKSELALLYLSLVAEILFVNKIIEELTLPHY